MRSAVHQLGSEVAIAHIESGEDLMSDAVAQPRSDASLFVLFAALALIIAGVGVYGTLSYTVVQRTRELGIRMALGAQRAHIFGMVIRQGVGSAAVGMLAGGSAALGCNTCTDQSAVWRETERSNHLCAGSVASHSSRAGGVLFSSTTRDVNESNERVAVGMIGALPRADHPFAGRSPL